MANCIAMSEDSEGSVFLSQDTLHSKLQLAVHIQQSDLRGIKESKWVKIYHFLDPSK